jgi:tight adherence protein C
VLVHQELILPFIFVGVAGGVYALLAIVDPYWFRVRARVSEIQRATDHRGLVATSALPTESGLRARMANFLRYLVPFRISDRARLQQRFAKAGIYSPSAMSKFFIVKLLLMAGPPLIAVSIGLTELLRFDKSLLVGCVIGGFGSLAPSLWLDRQISRRHLLLRKSLPDFLDVMIVCLEGGLSLQETIRRVGDELRLVHPALATELSIVQRDIELGASVDQALKRFATRSDYEGVRTLSTFFRETQRFGTNITEALRSHSDMLRSQREQAAEENAQKAAVKILIPTLLLIFPAIFVILVGPAVIQIHEAFAVK